MEETDASKLFTEEGTPVDGALETLKQKDVDRIKVFADAKTAAHEKGYSKAKGEVLATLESDLKGKHNVTSDKKGIELVEEIISIVSQKKSGSADPTDDQIKRHPLFIALQLDKDKEVKAVKTEMQKKIDDAENNFRKKATFDTVKEKAIAELEELGAIESDVPSIRDYHRGVMLRELEQYEYENMDTDSPIIKKGGELLTDDHSKTISFKELLANTAKKMYKFQAAEDRSSGGDNPKSKGQVSKIVIKKPKTEAEFQATLEQIENSTTLKAEDKLKHKIELNKLYKQAKDEKSITA